MTSDPALIVGLLLALKADPAKTAAEVKRFREASWTEVRRLADIDPVVMRAFRELLRKSAISDVGGPFDAIARRNRARLGLTCRPQGAEDRPPSRPLPVLGRRQ